MMKHLGILGLWLLLMSVGNARLGYAADEPVATVIAIRGIVTASTPAGVMRPLKRQDSVLLAETIRTGEEARAQLLFQDQTLITLGPQGELKLKDFSWRESERKGHLNVAVKEGAFRVLGGLITKHAPQNFKTETPPATIGIRGSSFAGEVRGEQLKVVFLGGKGIFVANAAGSVDISTPLYGTSVATGSAPGAPSQWNSDSLAPLERLLETKLGAGSEVHNLINQSDNRGAANIAIGAGNSANLGAVGVEQSRVQGTIVNQTDNRNAVNAAIGTGNTANLGAVDIKDSTVEGDVINESDNKGASNAAIGAGNEANTGTVKIK